MAEFACGVPGALDLLPFATVEGVPNGRLTNALHRAAREFEGTAALAVQGDVTVGLVAVSRSGSVEVALVAQRGVGMGSELFGALLPRLDGAVVVTEPSCLAQASRFWKRMGFESATVDGRLGMRAIVVGGRVAVQHEQHPSTRLRVRRKKRQ